MRMEMLKMKHNLFRTLICFLVYCWVAEGIHQDSVQKNINGGRSFGFPTDFVFGTASSSYQYEGAANDDGKGPSIWDTFTKKFSERIRDHSSGLRAIDDYHRYKEDVGIMKDIGFNGYRFSISWPRILPNGTLSGGINQQGIKYYNNLINQLLANGIEPFVTLFHWDLPQALEDKYGGFLSRQIVDDFRDYADLCFREFGERVKFWITLNEPHTFTSMGYANGTFPPSRCSPPTCKMGNSGTEPYLVAHHLLLAHAASISVYRNNYQMRQKGKIGISLSSLWVEPLDINSTADNNAAFRVLDFTYGWFMEPLNSGSYPVEMINRVKGRLPKFTSNESLMLKGSFDFIGINYYTANYAVNTECRTDLVDYYADYCAFLSHERKGVPIGPRAGSTWLYVYPQGLQELLLYTKYKFNNPVIYITENGISELNNNTISLNDTMRIDYYSSHISRVQVSMRELGVRVKGYFAWSLLDNFEWTDGYTVRFGMVYVDFKHGLRRYRKSSSYWFHSFLTN